MMAAARSTRRPQGLREVPTDLPGGDRVYLDVQVVPLLGTGPDLAGFSVLFHDVTRRRELQEQLERSNAELEAAHGELQTAHEELETTNEELQSTNEELETMNEELQSTNDELQTINDELRDRTTELDSSNAFLEAVLTSLSAGILVVNRDMRVQVWNSQAENLWGLRREEAVGEHLLNLDIGLPSDQLRPFIRQVLTDGGRRETEISAINRRGREVVVRVTFTPLTDGGDINAVMLAMGAEDRLPGDGQIRPVAPDGDPSELNQGAPVAKPDRSH